MSYRYLVSLVLVGFTSACTMKVPAPDQIVNEYIVENNDNGGGNAPSKSLQSPIISPSTLNSANGTTTAVSLALPENSPAGTSMYYTTDGTDPVTSPSAMFYMAPIMLTGTSQTVTVRATAWDGSAYSTETVGNYWFGIWELVGDNYIMQPKSKYLAVENGVVYVAQAGAVPGEYVIQKSVANVWSALPTITGCGGSWFGGNFMSPLTVENGIVYIACNQGNPGITVQKYESGAWSTIGSVNIPIEDAVDVIIKVRNGIPYIAAIDHGNWKIRAFRFDGSAWQPMGAQPLSPISTTRIGFDVNENNIPYISYKCGALVVSKYDVATDTWINLNSGILDMGNPYSGDLKIYDDGSTDGIPYILFRDVLGDTRIAKYSNGVWTHVSSITSASASASIDVHQGIPYITTEDGLGNTQIKRFNNGVWENVGTATFYTPNNPIMKIDQSTGNVYMYYSMVEGGTVYGIVETFGEGGSGISAHSGPDPFGFLI